MMECGPTSAVTLLPSEICTWTKETLMHSNRRAHISLPVAGAGYGQRPQDKVQQISDIVDRLGRASAMAQGLQAPITTAAKLATSPNRVYVLREPTEMERPRIVGFIKVGQKSLYLSDHREHPLRSYNAQCILDFFVHPSLQRAGHGKRLFKHVLEVEKCQPFNLALDRPSKKFQSFMAKHYKLAPPLFQSNNFVVFQQFFNHNKSKSVDTYRLLRPRVVHGQNAVLDASSNSLGSLYSDNEGSVGDQSDRLHHSTQQGTEDAETMASGLEQSRTESHAATAASNTTVKASGDSSSRSTSHYSATAAASSLLPSHNRARGLPPLPPSSLAPSQRQSKLAARRNEMCSELRAANVSDVYDWSKTVDYGRGSRDTGTHCSLQPRAPLSRQSQCALPPIQMARGKGRMQDSHYTSPPSAADQLSGHSSLASLCGAASRSSLTPAARDDSQHSMLTRSTLHASHHADRFAPLKAPPDSLAVSRDSSQLLASSRLLRQEHQQLGRGSRTYEGVPPDPVPSSRFASHDTRSHYSKRREQLHSIPTVQNWLQEQQDVQERFRQRNKPVHHSQEAAARARHISSLSGILSFSRQL